MDDTRALKILYRMIYLALFVRNINHRKIEETDQDRELADKCASLMEISEGKLIVREETLNPVDLTPLQLMTLRLFVHHFNQQTLVILFDGFDELVPHYKAVVYNLLSRFERFDGIRNIFITSRPYMLREEFRELFTNVAFYELSPFSDDNIVETVHLFMKSRFKQYLKNDNVKCLLEGLACTLKYHLGTFSQVPLFIRMALDVLEPLIATNVDFVGGTIDYAFFDSLETTFEELNLIETFVTNKIFKANVEKIQLPEAASNISGAISSREMLKKYKLGTHSLLALYELFDPEERTRLQVDDELAMECMDEIKTGMKTPASSKRLWTIDQSSYIEPLRTTLRLYGCTEIRRR
ncbi:AGAP012173-PA-like protein [Anopheles sinensis]|uniref:AGAP012173-PA-like protein n=1 Tax=Anopheles sinensis TaxID=74873 RepID=A0A084VI01_ANOSI|nr:AGAP012173-PA-like protein [Anopheles sinensis]